MPTNDEKRSKRPRRGLFTRPRTASASLQSNASASRPIPVINTKASFHLRAASSSRPDSKSEATSSPPSGDLDAYEEPSDPTPDQHIVADLLGEAVCQFKESTGVDLQDEESDLFRQLKGCTDPLAVISVLVKIADDFGLYRHPSANDIRSKIRSALRPIVRAVLSAGVLDTSGEVAAVSPAPGGKALFVAIGVLLKATKGVSDRFDAVAALLEKFEFYMRRLDVRIGVPVDPASRKLVVKILVEMLRTFATVTQMMHRTRMNHFFSVLIGKEDAVTEASRRLEILEVQDTRLTLASICKDVCIFSTSLSDALARVEDVSSDVAEISANMRLTMNMVSEIRTIAIATSNQESAIRGVDSRRIISPRPSFVSGSGEAGTAEMWRICLTITCLNAASNTKLLASNILSTFNGLPAGGRTNLTGGFAVIYSIAAYVASNNVEMSTTAALLNPAVFATTIIPLAMAYVAAFLCGVYVPRALGYSRSRTIIIIDVLGDHAIVPLDRYSKWEDIHRLLLERFADKNGAEYVRSRAYTIMDTGGESAIIKPEAWAQTVKEGMILEMSIVVRQPSRSLRCPWCAVAAQMPDEEFLHCKGCKRHYRSSQDDISTEAGERVVYGHDTVLEPTTHANSAGPEAFSNDVDRMHGVVESNALNAEDTQSRRIGDMKLFRRIIVELLREQLSGPGSGHMAGAHQRRVKADWEGATQELSAKASEGVIGRGDAAAVDFLCDMMRQFASFEGHGAQLVDGMSIEAILAVMSGPGDGKGSSGVSDEGALGPDDKYDFDQQLLLDFEAWERGENDGDTVGAIISEHERKRG